MSTAHGDPAYTRGDIFLEDGDLVLICQDTAFCVYRTTLVVHSEVFRDMFAMPQPPDAELFEGLPLVHLTDDKTELTYVLKTLYSDDKLYVGPFT